MAVHSPGRDEEQRRDGQNEELLGDAALDGVQLAGLVPGVSGLLVNPLMPLWAWLLHQL